MATELIKIELVDLVKKKRDGAGVASTDTSAYYYYKINKQIGFVDQSGVALSANDSVTLYYYRKPLSDGTETMSDAIEPIIDDRWDDYLVFRSCFELTGEPKFLAMAKDEMQRTKVLQLAEINRSYTVPVNREYD